MELLLLLSLIGDPAKIDTNTCSRVRDRSELRGLFRAGELCDYVRGIPRVKVRLDVSVSQTALDQLHRISESPVTESQTD